MKEVASIAVFNGDKLLMGVRNDSGKWTLPGGHLEKNERPHDGAYRELEEETGIQASQLIPIGDELIEPAELKYQIRVYCFRYECETDVTAELDPDDEVKRWQWIDVSNGLPKSIEQNLHASKNVTLKILGLQRDWMPMLYIVPDAKKSFVIDLSKGSQAGRPHKYLRKYKSKAGKWIYIYHEGDGNGRALDDAAVTHLKRLVELRHEHAKRLMDDAEKIHPEKVKHLARLHDLGHEPATKHLKKIGLLDHVKQEKLSRQVLESADKYERPLSDKDMSKVKDAVALGLKKMHDRFTQHPGSAPEVKLTEAGISKETLLNDIIGNNPQSLNDFVKNFDKAMKKVDAAHEGVTSQWGEVTEAGGYGNMMFNTFMDRIEDSRLIPRGVAKKLRRTQDTAGAMGVTEADIERLNRKAATRRERAEAERRAAEERRVAEERRLSRELDGSMASFVASMSATSMSAQDVLGLHKAFKNIFGRNMRKEDWPYDFSDKGIEVKITEADYGESNVDFSFEAKDANGRIITRSWDRTWNTRSGKPHIHNNYLKTRADTRGHRIGQLINMAQQELMEKVGGGYVTVHAALGVGGYNWANQGFSFSGGLEEKKRRFKSFLSEHGINLTPQEMALIKEPCHIAAFDDGRRFERKNIVDDDGNRIYIDLSPKQKETRSLTGVRGEMPLTDAEMRDGRVNRMAVHLGKMFLLGGSWSGVWQTGPRVAKTMAHKYFRNRQLGTLGTKYNAMITRHTRSEQRGGLPAAGTPRQAQAPP
jgi:ADP-ribose pyrophosphatase YjhB (NUDIX family)